MTQVVLGIGFGDEGKGLTTAYLASKHPNIPVVRFSGGQQAEHTVYYEKDKYHIFSMFGSGTISGNHTYLSEDVIIDPISIMKEHLVLKEKGFDPVLTIHKNCKVTTIFDIASNQADNTLFEHGTCGRGIFKTIERTRNHYNFIAGDLLEADSIIKLKLKLISEYYGLSDYYLEVVYDNTIKAKNYLLSQSKINIADFDHNLDNDDEIEHYIYEGAQGLLLDQTNGFFPNVTPSDTGVDNIFKAYYDNNEVYLVTRAYQTRHGNGYIRTDKFDPNDINNPYETCKTNENQGSLRIGYLDLDVISYGLNRHNIDYCAHLHLVITCLDCLKAYKLWHKDILLTFDSEDDFVNYIKLNLPIDIDKVFLSHSPYFYNIKEWK